MSPYRLVAIGASAGGTQALQALLAGLPPDFSLPLVVVLHRGADSPGLAEALGRHSALPVAEAEDKVVPQPGIAYLAPAEYHLLVDGDHLALSIDPPVKYARPSINVLFESAAEALGPGVIAVLLTGRNDDGAEGLAAVKSRGGIVVVQEPGGAESSIMPQAGLDALDDDNAPLPLEGIGPRLVSLAQAERGTDHEPR